MKITCKSFLVVTAFLAAAGCQTTTKTTVAVDPNAEVGSETVPVARALNVFDAVCGQSLPDFASAPRLMTQNGITNKASTGTVYSATEDLSFKIVDGPGIGNSCSMVFVSKEPKKQVFDAYRSKFIRVDQTPLGLTGGYTINNRVAVVLISEPRRVDGQNYYNLRLLSER